jgi:hypothetical protein
VLDVQLGEDGHRYANPVGAPLFSFMRTAMMGLLRRAGYRSVHSDHQELVHAVHRIHAMKRLNFTS